LIQVRDLEKSYGSTRAVAGISFQVRSGQIYGLLGPNGAGKTTTISCISGLLRPDAGRITVDGLDLAADPIRVKAKLGIVPQETAIYPTLSAYENVTYFGSLHGLSGSELRGRARQVLESVGLSADSKQASRKFSGGMKRRLNLAVGLVHRPKVLLLDEPTVGIDPQARINILDVVRSIQQEGTAVLYTTHYLEEAETLCTEIGIMDHGKVLAEGTVEELRRLVGEGTVVSLRGDFRAEAFNRALNDNPDVRLLSLEDGAALLTVGGARRSAADLLSLLLRAGIEVAEISMREPSLQNVFLKLTGRELRD
jgi:ABC-2 type transport system ATP-binding protein